MWSRSGGGCYIRGMNREDEAKFVISAAGRQGEAMVYANHNGNLVDLKGAQTYGYDEAVQRAGEMAARLGASVWVAPLLFGFPDVESAEYFAPPQST